MSTKFSIRVSAFIFTVLTFSFVGCKSEVKPGHYKGALLKKVDHVLIQKPIDLEVREGSSRTLVIVLSSPDGAVKSTARIQRLKNHQLQIQAELLGQNPIILSPVKSDQDKEKKCYVRRAPPTIEFCFKRDQFFLQALDEHHSPYLQVSANLFKVETNFDLEPPIALTLSEAVDLAFKKNFDSRIAYEHVLQARYAAVSAYLNLVPHLSSNLIWNAAPNYITYVATIQALAPFLLPSYWFQAKELSIDHEMKKLALIIMRANLVTTLEELTYSLNRDTSIFDDQNELIRDVLNFQIKVTQSNLIPESRAALLDFSDFLLKALESDRSDMRKLIQQDRFSLAQVLGYHNIEAIENVRVIDEILTIHEASLLDPAQVAGQATERSFELRQLDDLERIAKLKKIENLFAWIDPTGDPKQSFGLNLIPQQKQAKSQILEIQIQRDQMKTTIYQSAYKLALNYNEAYESYFAVQKEILKNNFNLEEILNEAIAGMPVDKKKLKSRGQRYMGYQVATHTVLANFRTARAKKDRYLLMGYYAHLLPHFFLAGGLSGPLSQVLLNKAKLID